MKYAYTILYVENVQETIAFYEKAFGFQRKFVTPENDYGELISGDTTIAFASFELAQSNLNIDFSKKAAVKPYGIELAFTSENIDADFEKAKKAGAIEVAPIATKPWGQKVGYLKDNNDFLIEICTPMN